MSRTIFYIIVTITIVLFIYIGTHSSYEYTTDGNTTILTNEKKDSIKNSILAQVVRPEERPIKMRLQKLPSNHSELEDKKLFYTYHQREWDNQEAYNKDNDYLNLLNNSKNTASFLQNSNRIILKWKNKNIPSFYHKQLVFTLIRINENTFLSETDKAIKIHKYYDEIRKNMDDIDLQLYKYIMQYGNYEVNYLQQQNNTSMNEQRKNICHFWLYVGAMFQAGIDTTYNFNREIYMQADIPQGYVGSDKYFAGMDPSCIKEPELHQAYINAIIANGWIITNYNLQLDLRKDYYYFLNDLINNITSLYSLPPENNSELDALLKEYIVDEEDKALIMNLVKNNFEENKK
jgi:hypothetical protein